MLLVPSLLLVACRPAAVEVPVVADAPERALVDAVVVDGDRPSEPLPMVVALHGRGDTPEHFVGALDGLDGVRVVALRAPLPYHDGRSWFDASARELSAADLGVAVAREADAVAARIAAARSAWPTVGDPVVTGFSQGAMLSWTLAVRHPEGIAAAVPVAGFLPESLAPEAATEAQRATPIRALHGDADTVLPVARAELGRAALAAAGFDVTLEVFPGVPHAISPDERTRWHALLVALSSPPVPAR